MKRIATVVGISLGLVALLAPAAFAKGSGEVMVKGNGLSIPIRIKGGSGGNDEGAFWQFMSSTGIFDTYRQTVPPPGDLGPRYTLTIYVGRPDQPPSAFDP